MKLDQINDERFDFFAASGGIGDSLNDIEVSYWQDVRLYTSDDLNDLRGEWADAGHPEPTPPHQFDVD